MIEAEPKALDAERTAFVARLTDEQRSDLERRRRAADQPEARGTEQA